MSEIHFYIDDSGTRHPDKNPNDNAVGDWFALGGVLVDSDDEEHLRDLHSAFRESWGIDGPLHSADIRFRKNDFGWLKELDSHSQDRFFRELQELLVQAPVLGLACVIDRPGYNARYREKYGRQRWSLCKTAFAVAVERAAKFAISRNKRLRVFPERSDPDSERKLKSYFQSMREDGMPFQEGGKAKYEPLSAETLKHTLREFRLKYKSSPPMQFGDLYLYPICRGGYVEYKPLQALQAEAKLLDSQIAEEDQQLLGIKYSCFELVRSRAENNKRPP